MGDLLGFVEPNFLFDPVRQLDPDLNNIAWFSMRHLLRLSPWSGDLGLSPGKFFWAHFVYIEIDFGD